MMKCCICNNEKCGEFITIDNQKYHLSCIADLKNQLKNCQLQQTKKIFESLANLIKQNKSCSYRYLIYDLLGFEYGDYSDLIDGLTVINMLVDYQQKKSKIETVLKHIDMMISIIEQQPTDDNSWILKRLKKFRKILGDDYE